jgi:hypothetical protein
LSPRLPSVGWNEACPEVLLREISNARTSSTSSVQNWKKKITSSKAVFYFQFIKVRHFSSQSKVYYLMVKLFSKR